MFDAKAFGSRLRQLRKQAGLTQEALANEIQINCDHLGKLEGGHGNPSLYLLLRFHDFFSVSLDYLEFGEEHKDIAIRQGIRNVILDLQALERQLP